MELLRNIKTKRIRMYKKENNKMEFWIITRNKYIPSIEKCVIIINENANYNWN